MSIHYQQFVFITIVIIIIIAGHGSPWSTIMAVRFVSASASALSLGVNIAELVVTLPDDRSALIETSTALGVCDVRVVDLDEWFEVRALLADRLRSLYDFVSNARVPEVAARVDEALCYIIVSLYVYHYYYSHIDPIIIYHSQ